uniref:Uncharacterized protein n=1 Tax=Arundo donax TaxID=35708 RepID=A0A0A9F555_ARUDO
MVFQCLPSIIIGIAAAVLLVITSVVDLTQYQKNVLVLVFVNCHDNLINRN